MPYPVEQHIRFDLIFSDMAAASLKDAARSAAADVAPMIGISERILAERMGEGAAAVAAPLGGGVAITHMTMSGLIDPINIFIRLKKPIPAIAHDHEPIDIFCIVLCPEREGAAYLRTMSRISRLLRHADTRNAVRRAHDKDDIARALRPSQPALRAA